MSKLIQRLMKTVQHFTVVDFALFKICLVTIGILLGTYLHSFFNQHLSIIWGIAIVTYILLLVQLFRYDKKNKSSSD